MVRSQGWRNRTGLTYLLAVFVSDNWPFSCTRISAEDYAILEETSDDGGTSACGLWERQALLLEEGVAERDSKYESSTILQVCPRTGRD